MISMGGASGWEGGGGWLPGPSTSGSLRTEKQIFSLTKMAL